MNKGCPKGIPFFSKINDFKEFYFPQKNREIFFVKDSIENALSIISADLKKHNIDSENTFFIGDSYFLDFIPSNRLGIFPILLDENNRYPFVSEKNRIKNITDCMDLIFNEFNK